MTKPFDKLADGVAQLAERMDSLTRRADAVFKADADERKWWGQNKGKKYGPASSREEAAKLVFAQFPKIKEAMTGKGLDGPSFDIQWVRNPSW